jgi:hypothetical protein
MYIQRVVLWLILWSFEMDINGTQFPPKISALLNNGNCLTVFLSAKVACPMILLGPLSRSKLDSKYTCKVTLTRSRNHCYNENATMCSLNLTFMGPCNTSIFQYISNKMQLYTVYLYLENCSTCFGWYLQPSSGAHTNVSTASGICHTVTATCHYHGGLRTVGSSNGVTNTRCCRYCCMRS